MPPRSQRHKDKAKTSGGGTTLRDELPQENMQSISATRGLQDALGLQYHHRAFSDIRSTLRRLADDIFDFRLGAGRQPEDDWTKFLEKVFEVYPRFKKRPQVPVLYFLRKYTKQYIGVLRWRQRKASQNDQPENKDNISVIKSNIKQIQAASTQTAHSSILASETFMNAPATLTSSYAGGAVPRLTQFRSGDSELPSLSLLTALREFLESCHPPLTHLLPSLVKMGIKSDETLQEVFNWPMPDLVIALHDWHFSGYITALECQALRVRFTQKQNESAKDGQAA